MQEDFDEIGRVDLDMRFVAEEEQVVIPDAVQYGEDCESEWRERALFMAESSSEAEPVTSSLVQEQLEHAYPNGLTVEIIAESLR